MEKIMPYGLIGRKLGHSDSKIIHEKFGLTEYALHEIEPDEIESFLNTPGLKGLNVTIPYKRDVIPFLDALSDEARAVGSVNTIVFTDDGRKIGHNTDVYGFMYMTKRAGIDVRNKKVLIFGSGGASAAAKRAMENMGAREILIISRSGKNNYENLSLHEDAQILINATPVGMYPNPEGTIIEPSRFKNAEGALDMVYNPSVTEFLRKARECSIPSSNGLPMLVAQAKLAEEYFLNRNIPDAETERVLSQVARNRISIALIGMPGCGKTSIGKALGEITGFPVYDADAEIEREEGMSIPEIMQQKGISYFRDLESKIIDRLSLLRGAVIVTGGGAVLREENRIFLKRNARVYRIQRDISLLPTEGRPLSMTNDLRKMAEEREPFYKAAMDKEIMNDSTVKQAAEAIRRDFYENTRD